MSKTKGFPKQYPMLRLTPERRISAWNKRWYFTGERVEYGVKIDWMKPPGTGNWEDEYYLEIQIIMTRRLCRTERRRRVKEARKHWELSI
jgi:hypothetical protein